MSGGRWVREDNGDYQHYTDEEIAAQERSKTGYFFAVLLVVGPFLMFADQLLIGAIVTLVGVVGLFIMPSETIGGILILGVVAGFFYLLYYLGKSEEEKEKKEKKEQVTQAPSSTNSQSNVASFKAVENTETVGAYDESDYEEEVEDNYSSDETALNEESSYSDGNSINDREEVMPEFPGGPQALMDYLKANVIFPKIAEEEGIQGKVVVSYVIDVDGSVTDVQVVQSVHPALDKEAMRVVKNMPKWIPGKQDGKAVQVKYSLPINFYYQ